MLAEGPEALLEQLQGSARVRPDALPNLRGSDPTHARLGWDIRYASESALPEGGRRIVLALDQTMSFCELANHPRTADYPFTFIHVNVDADGEGTGNLSMATRVHFDEDKNDVELETVASEPLRL